VDHAAEVDGGEALRDVVEQERQVAVALLELGDVLGHDLLEPGELLDPVVVPAASLGELLRGTLPRLLEPTPLVICGDVGLAHRGDQLGQPRDVRHPVGKCLAELADHQRMLARPFEHRARGGLHRF